MKYTTLKVIRTKDLPDKAFELILERRDIQYIPGDCLLIKGLNNEFRPYFVASGMQEPWFRIIIEKNLNDSLINYLYNIKKGSRIKVKREPFSIFPNLINQKQKTIFIASGIGIAPFLSYFSTYPLQKITKVIYHVQEEGINVAWLKTRQDIIINTNPNILINEIPLNKKCRYYLCGSGKIVTQFKTAISGKVKDSKVFTCSILT